MNEDPSPESILECALNLADPQARAAWLDEACGEDEALRGEIESLLAAHCAADAAFMDTLVDPVWSEVPGEKEGDTIGRYKLLQQIGEGGFGTVYMAAQTEPVKRRVALKVIKAGMDSKEVIARFEAERQALALIDHPHIAKVREEIVEILQQQKRDALVKQWQEEARVKVDAWEKENKGAAVPAGAGENATPKGQGGAE